MSWVRSLSPEFVEFIPNELADGIIYVSMQYGTAVHRCCCGCGHKVVTPITPTDWTLTFDGEAVSLNKSIGNWSFPCQSHYWIRCGQVQWSDGWSEDQIAAGRAYDRSVKDEYFRRAGSLHPERPISAGEPKQSSPLLAIYRALKRWLIRR